MILPKNPTLLPGTVQALPTSQLAPSLLKYSKFAVHTNDWQQQQQAIIIAGNTCQLQSQVQPQKQTPIILASAPAAQPQQIYLPENSNLANCQVVCGSAPQQIDTLQGGAVQTFNGLNTGGGQRLLILQTPNTAATTSNFVQLQPAHQPIICVTSSAAHNTFVVHNEAVKTFDNSSHPASTAAASITSAAEAMATGSTSSVLQPTAYVISSPSSGTNVCGQFQNAGNVTFVQLNWAGQQNTVVGQQQTTQFIPLVRQQSPVAKTVPKSTIVLGNHQFQSDPYDPSKWQLIPLEMAPTSATGTSQINTSGKKSTRAVMPSTSGNKQVQTGNNAMKRQKRVACSCPNCKGNEGLPKQERKKKHLCHVAGCSKTYVAVSHLRAHLRWHAGDRPFECDHPACTKRFLRSDQLRRHKRIHSSCEIVRCFN